MRLSAVIIILIFVGFGFSFSIHPKNEYSQLYWDKLGSFMKSQDDLLRIVQSADLKDSNQLKRINKKIHDNRGQLKAIDFWLRYFEPVAYRKLNGPLPVEWENEVFEKFEPPYRRQGAGLSLAEEYLETEPNKDSLSKLIRISIDSTKAFEADSVTGQLASYHHFYLANRLYLLNLAALYTTGFECPDSTSVVPELKAMVSAVTQIYAAFNNSYPQQRLSVEYEEQYAKMISYLHKQADQFSSFDHFTFIKDLVNPLFGINQQLIIKYGVISKNYNDYSLNNDCTTIFNKSLYTGQNTRGIYSLIEDEKLLKEIRSIGKLLFYDPILSNNNKRSCASCHKPTAYFTDTTVSTPLQINGNDRLPRNAPSLINVVYNHLIMLDGKHISLQAQAKEVITNPIELCSKESELIKKVLSCKEYRDAFRKFLKHTPEEKTVTLDHIVSAITFYYAGFSNYEAPFDDAMNNKSQLDDRARAGFNLFMGKAQCGTCHFVPMFNGVKPPYIGSEFEVLGVPADTSYKDLSNDKGRWQVNPAVETLHAFRTGTIRNSSFTKPYMHNGIFSTMDQVIHFYDIGGGAAKKLSVPNQTLDSQPLNLSQKEKEELIAFMLTLDEKIKFEAPPPALPVSSNKKLNQRKTGGEY